MSIDLLEYRLYSCMSLMSHPYDDLLAVYLGTIILIIAYFLDLLNNE